ncbi:MAG: transcriptional repressor [Prevotellaceae bacterium]|jgi:Fur family ferric uptake transcriptional regulator|nr:transcriptional repressor [Prevotellaceae bacterium]
MKYSKEKDSVMRIFTSYLEHKGYRKTRERFAVIDEIYSICGHFDVESLYETLKKKYAISIATVYNTIELLLDCNLIKKHQFGENTSRYEKSLECNNHDHLICTSCGAVVEFWNPVVEKIQETAADSTGFEVSYHVLYFYGLCPKCKSQKADETQRKIR